MCVISCTIEFENAPEYYQPGEVITGAVILRNSGTILLKALSLQFAGFACTKWEKPVRVKKSVISKPKIFVEYREDYVSTTSFLIGSEMANPKPVELGKYNYNFIINIPQNIPSTFDSPLGFIRYELMVYADHGDHKDLLYNSPVHIEQLKDLRIMHSAIKLPVETEQLEEKSYIHFWRQPLHLKISVPQKAFVAGECISIYIKLTNPAKINLNTIISNLNRITTYKGFIAEKTMQTITQMTTIASKSHSFYGNTPNFTQILQQIFMPKTPPTMNFDECKCIRLSYELEVLVTGQNKKRCVRAVIPILVGSISLKSDVNVLDNNVTSITLTRSMEELTLPSAMDLRDNATFTETSNISTSMSSLASSYKEADFMTAVNLNKKSRHQLLGYLGEFKPKYLYYDLPEGFHHNFQKDVSTTSQHTRQENQHPGRK